MIFQVNQLKWHLKTADWVDLCDCAACFIRFLACAPEGKLFEL